MSSEKGFSRDAWRALALSLLFVSVLLSVFLVIERRPDPVAPPDDSEPREPMLVLHESSFEELPGWEADDLEGVALALGRSCEVFTRRAGDRSLSRSGGQES